MMVRMMATAHTARIGPTPVRHRHASEVPERILADRLPRGEIDIEEY